MAKGTYQTYTQDTSIEAYRADFIHRAAMCGALEKRHPGLAAIGQEAEAIVEQIDTRRAALQLAEDDQIRARALENATRLDVIETYTEVRRTLFAKRHDVATLLPDAPSTLNHLGTKNFRARTEQAFENLKALPDSDPVKAALLPTLEEDLGGFRKADDAEDKTHGELVGGRVALTLYKTELSQAREAQMGAVLKVLGDREHMAMFALPWRKAAKPKDDATPDTPPAP